MSYEYHNENECDKCGKDVGKDNLKPVDFLYLDKNDKSHEDEGDGYRQYWICEDCQKLEKVKFIPKG